NRNPNSPENRPRTRGFLQKRLFQTRSSAALLNGFGVLHGRLSKVIWIVECPIRSCTRFGLKPSSINNDAAACRKLCIPYFGRSTRSIIGSPSSLITRFPRRFTSRIGIGAAVRRFRRDGQLRSRSRNRPSKI